MKNCTVCGFPNPDDALQCQQQDCQTPLSIKAKGSGHKSDSQQQPPNQGCPNCSYLFIKGIVYENCPCCSHTFSNQEGAQPPSFYIRVLKNEVETVCELHFQNGKLMFRPQKESAASNVEGKLPSGKVEVGTGENSDDSTAKPLVLIEPNISYQLNELAKVHYTFPQGEYLLEIGLPTAFL